MIRPKNLSTSLCLLPLLTSLAGCSGTYRNYELKDKSAPQIITSVEKNLSERTSVTAEYFNINGNSSQNFDSGSVLVNGDLISGDENSALIADYNFSFHKLSADFNIDAIKSEFYTLSISPTLGYFYYDLDISVQDRSKNISEEDYGIGLKIENQFKIYKDIYFNIGISKYNNKNSDYLLTGFAEFNYAINSHWSTTLGFYNMTYKNDVPYTVSLESCWLEGICPDSEVVSIDTEGISIGINYTF